ncbi:DUF1129 family protein [Oceanobacillus halophilus]|uniref:DUF1129 family protein n=1 Tax=Oceanobacillus halophilus TaxID=930130 RepID=A0A494ZW84_9BACI|nr:DUF1129 family protein [Oceanobacillus halophilus]RKQ30904.1 DUF1129 family protein [Oceanobacillus halophilus]
MIAKDYIQLNNERRKKLNKENESLYLDMVVYIRTNANKSEQQTEEVLLELLDHLLKAQANGKTAKDVFGEDLKAYCDELIQEIPAEKTSNHVRFILFMILNLFAIITLFTGIGGYLLHLLFDIGSGSLTFPIGSGISIVILDLLLLTIWIIILLKWIKSSTFKEKKPNKWIEFLQLWLICTVYIGLSLAVLFLMPDFGTTVNLYYPVIIGLGLVLLVATILFNHKYRMTK